MTFAPMLESHKARARLHAKEFLKNIHHSIKQTAPVTIEEEPPPIAVTEDELEGNIPRHKQVLEEITQKDEE